MNDIEEQYIMVIELVDNLLDYLNLARKNNFNIFFVINNKPTL